MKICCVSDLHGYFPKTEGGDLLIVAGDHTSDDSEDAWIEFENWIFEQDYQEKIIIAGNHDKFLASMDTHNMWKYWGNAGGNGVTYLCDSGTTFEGLKIWGSPWSLWFYGINPYCKAFTGSESDLKKKYDLIPDDIDILITHEPPYGIFDKTAEGKHVGSHALRETLDRVRPSLHVFGHIHECGGRQMDCVVTKYVNASHVNRAYEPVHPPIYLEF